jgi:hypothetical protein
MVSSRWAGTYKLTGGCAGFINTFVAPIALSKASDAPLLFREQVTDE